MRKENWVQRIAAYFTERRYMPFEWATNDCFTFAMRAVEAMRDEALELPEYGSAISAARLLAERSLRDRVSDLFGSEVHPAFLQRGDIALVLLEARESLTICMGSYLLGPGLEGQVAVPREMAICGWKVD